MYLRASNVSLYFKLTGHHDDLPDAPADRKLGGMIESYKGRQFVRALDNISLDLRQGDRLAIIGHNGSGKSTLLRVLAGIYHPQQGIVECDRAVSSLFNISLGFRADASGYRNILLKGLIAGKTRGEIDRLLPGIAEFTELGPYLHMPLRTYSQGMAMRLAFAIATAFSNDILLMDEWIGAGDAQFLEKAVSRMTSFVDSAQILVLASHSASLLRRVANKAIWLESGRIRAVGSVDDLLSQYETEAKASARARRAAMPIIREMISLTVTPAEIVDWVPGSKGRVGEVSWDTSGSGVESVDIYAANLQGKENLCFTGGTIGTGKTGPWLRPGFEFRLKDGDTDELLASVVVGPVQDRGIDSQTNVVPDKDSLTVTPAEIPDWVPGSKGIIGDISWDASSSGAEAVDVYAINPQGKESLCFSGGTFGQGRTGAWLRPGFEFRLKNSATDELLATAIIGPIPESGIRSLPNASPEPVSLKVVPSEMPDWVPGSKGIIGELSWDASSSGAEAVDIYAINPQGKESLCLSGGTVGQGRTGAWLRPGFEFRMKDSSTNEVLATASVGPVAVNGGRSPPGLSGGRISLTIDPAEIPGWVPGSKGVVGEVVWDASSSGADAVDVYAVNPQGKESLCFSGGAIGRGKTGAWLRPGFCFRLKDSATNETLATATVGSGVGTETDAKS
jgi:ABC-type polysaccharide/polyol phosphate transport system ATPase subunit